MSLHIHPSWPISEFTEVRAELTDIPAEERRLVLGSRLFNLDAPIPCCEIRLDRSFNMNDAAVPPRPAKTTSRDMYRTVDPMYIDGTDPVSGNPYFLGAFSENEASVETPPIAAHIRCYDTVLHPIEGVGLSLTSNPDYHHVIMTLSDIRRSGSYNVMAENISRVDIRLQDDVIDPILAGTPNPFQVLVPESDLESASCRSVTMRGYQCFCINELLIPPEFAVSRGHRSPRHHLCFPKTAVPCKFMTRLFGIKPCSMAVCEDIVRAPWRLHCFAISVAMEPKPFRDSYGGDVWKVASLLFTHNDEASLFFETATLLGYFEENDYHYEPTKSPVPHHTVVELVAQLLECAGEADKKSIERFLFQYSDEKAEK
jgi:hypothetical protein